MMKKIVFLIILTILIAGCDYTFTDRKGGEYRLDVEDKELKDRIIFNKCSVPTGFACLDYSVKTDRVSVTLKNSAGIDTEDFYIAVYCGKSDSTKMPNGAMKQFHISCTLEKDTQFESELYIIYTNPFSGITHRKKGRLMARVV